MMQIELSRLESPLGTIVLTVCEQGLCALEFAESEQGMLNRLQRAHPDAVFEDGPRAKQTARQVKDYFDGSLDALTSLRVAPSGTPFQKQVWAALREVPVGATSSYAKIAKTIGNPKAVRAVGAANSKNPIALVVPCHRVIAADGKLHGYAGGLWRKQWLLEHEKAWFA